MSDLTPSPFPAGKGSEDAPRIEMLQALLKLFSLEQLEFLVNHCESAVKVTGFARVEIVFENGHVRFLYPSVGYEFPKVGKNG